MLLLIIVFIEESEKFDSSRAFRLFFFFENTCAIMGLASDASFRICNSFRKWVKTKGVQETIGVVQLIKFLHDLQVNEISVKASGRFPMAFQVFAQLAGAPVMYFVICIQSGGTGVVVYKWSLVNL